MAGGEDKTMPARLARHAGSWPAATQHAACPGDETLIGLVEHALPADAMAALADHVDSCERCRATIGTLAAVDGGAGPRKVGRYELEDQLGAGGMGVVWAAFDPMLQRRVAIKLMRPEVGEHGPARMLREARALAQLQHPNVVAVHDVGEHEGDVFLATELVDGEPLDRWQHGKTAPEIVAAYAQAARGLAAAHAMGLVHRDVKPSNILVARDGRVRVGDFGLARRGAVAGDRAAAVALTDPKLTREGAVVGTPAYMAPEQRLGQSVDGRADQFALCVALAEALTGKRPDAGEKPAIAARGMSAIAAAIARGLRRVPAQRFPDMAALASALEAPPPRRPWGLVVAGAIVAVGGTLAGVFMFGASPIVQTAQTPPTPIAAPTTATQSPTLTLTPTPIAATPTPTPTPTPTTTPPPKKKPIAVTSPPAPVWHSPVDPTPIVPPPPIMPTGMPECDAHLATMAKLAVCPTASADARENMRDAIAMFQHQLDQLSPITRAEIIRRGDNARACVLMAKNVSKLGTQLGCDMTIAVAR